MIVNRDLRSGVGAALAFGLPLLAIVLMSSFNRVTASVVDHVRIDLVLVGLAVCVAGGIGLQVLGRVGTLLGPVVASCVGACDIGLMIAGAAAVKSITNGEAPTFATGLAQAMIAVLVGAALGCMIRFANAPDHTGPDENGGPA